MLPGIASPLCAITELRGTPGEIAGLARSREIRFFRATHKGVSLDRDDQTWDSSMASFPFADRRDTVLLAGMATVGSGPSC